MFPSLEFFGVMCRLSGVAFRQNRNSSQGNDVCHEIAAVIKLDRKAKQNNKEKISLKRVCCRQR